MSTTRSIVLGISYLISAIVITDIAADGAMTVHEARELAARMGVELTNIRADVAEVCVAAREGRFRGQAQITVGKTMPQINAHGLTFSLDSLDADLDRVQAVIEKYEEALVGIHRRARGQHEEPPEMSMEDRLRQAEAGTAQSEPDRFVIPEDNFEAASSYLDDRRERQAERDRQAEADMGRVAEERRQAAERRHALNAAERKIEEQNARWQNELDLQATQDAEAEAEWKRTHGAGAFLKGLVRTVVGGAITTVSGSFATTIAQSYAQNLIHDRFPPPRRSSTYNSSSQ